MLNKYLFILAIIGTGTLVYIPKTNAYGICTCFCCDGQGCDPIFQGGIELPSCDGLNCIAACKNKFPSSCSTATTYEIDGSCTEFVTSTTRSSTPSTSTLTFVSTSTSTYAYGICSCACCNGEKCVPTYQGSIQISSCDGQHCTMACQNRFPWTCGSTGSHEVDAKCTTVVPTTTTSTTPTTSSTSTYVYGICSCTCCNGEECVPTYQGSIQISSCDGQNCIAACQNRFPWTCGSTGSHEVDAKCSAIVPTTTTTSTTPITSTYYYGTCSCSCCNGEKCVPTYQGCIQISSCDGQNCIVACQNRFPWTCGSSGTHEIDAKCRQVTPSTTTAALSTTNTHSTSTSTISSTDSTSTSTISSTDSTSTSTTSSTDSTSTASTICSTEFTTTQTSSTSSSTTYAYGICSCFCCNGAGCNPILQGKIEILSCDGLNCIQACKSRFPSSCSSPDPHKVEGNCKG